MSNTVPPRRREPEPGMATRAAQPRFEGLPTTQFKPEATLSWKDATGPHEIRIDGPTTIGSSRQCPVFIVDPTARPRSQRRSPEGAG